MREIKFRAWDGDTMRSLWQALDTGLAVIQHHKDSYEIEADYEDVKIMQYTGLKDEYGVEIYEGDIVRGSYGIPGRTIKSAVTYNGSAFMVDTTGHTPSESTLYKLIDYLGQIEVIGNIYENPELLD